MIRLFVGALLIFLMSCYEENPHLDVPFKEKAGEQEVWVCWNPETKYHGELCTPDCLEDGQLDRFCWLLKKSDCTDAGLEWQVNNCHLLE